MTTTPAGTDLYYDPYDFDIDADPYPVWKRLRDEAPLYYNEKYDFYALSRFDDVERCLADWQTYSSAKGSVLELIKSGMEIPPGSFLFEDPPDHDLHRGLSAGSSRPRRWPPSSPRSARSAPRSLDPLVGRAASTSSPTSAPRCRCAPSACCSASPRRTRRRSETASTRACASRRASCPTSRAARRTVGGDGFAEYIDWRAEHPSDDLMTELLNAEFTDETARHARSPGTRSSATSACSPAPATRPRRA